MNTQVLLSSPFAQMLAPQDVFRALRDSISLGDLPGRICRPLDKFETITTGNAFDQPAALETVAGEAAPFND